MKNFLILLLLCISVIINACSLPLHLPEDGEWYCEELKISIDFSLITQTPECVKYYNDDGNFESLLGLLDYGGTLFICSLDQSIEYIAGEIDYIEKENVVTFTTLEDEKYIFTKRHSDN